MLAVTVVAAFVARVVSLAAGCIVAIANRKDRNAQANLRLADSVTLNLSPLNPKP